MSTNAIVGIAIAAAALWIVSVARTGTHNVAYGTETGSTELALTQAAVQVPNLSGNWTGTAAILGQPISLALSIDQGGNSVTGACSLGDYPPNSFDITIEQEHGNVSGTWSVDGKHPRPFIASLNNNGDIRLTLNAGAGKHPNCEIYVNGMLSDDGTEIAGSFKSSDGCKNAGQTGTFQITSQS
jgi:hypothetical protein